MLANFVKHIILAMKFDVYSKTFFKSSKFIFEIY